MTKKELKQKLKDKNISFDEKSTHRQLSELLSSPVIEIPLERTELELNIIKLFDVIKNKERGTAHEMSQLFAYHNSYFKRADRASCATCVSRVYNKMMKLYERIKF